MEAELGFGDEIMASGMARGAAARGKRVAFGDGLRIQWGPWAEPIFRRNPNVAKPGSEGAKDLEWIPHYKGHRLYNKLGSNQWIWDYSFRPIPGEIFFDPDEQLRALAHGEGFVLIEPSLPKKACAPNKRWPIERYQAVSDRLRDGGRRVVQFFRSGDVALERVESIKGTTFREALAILARAAIYIGPEGGLHHGAAAVGIPAVVLFGGFIPPRVTGYATHTNLTGGAVACGSLSTCEHCRKAMDAISIDEVMTAAERHLMALAA